jgi:hypothetical protein
MQYQFPTNYDAATCYLVPINATLIPHVAGALRLFENRGSWISDQDYERGYNAFAELQICMTLLCAQQLIESNDRLYRMLDTALFGTIYTVESTDPLLVLPTIAPTHSLDVQDATSLLGRLEVQRQLLENALNGTETPNYDRANGVRDLLEQLITAVQNGPTNSEDLLAQLQIIAALLA